MSRGVDIYARTPNNHLLNTQLMRFFSILTGNSELSLRMPNVLAFILYCIAGLGIIRNIKKPALSVFFMAILVLNTMMLEFFGLARGYGLSMGLSMAGFYCLFMLDNPSLPLKKYLVYFILTLIFSMFAVYANLSAVNLHIAIIIVLVAGLIPYLKTNLTYTKSKSALIFGGILLIDLLVLLPAIFRLLMLQDNNELSGFGGTAGIIKTTVSSLISIFFYYENYPPEIFSTVLKFVIGVFAISGIWVTLRLFRKRFDNFSRTFFILFLLLLAPVLQYYLFKIPYPTDRTTLLYPPVFYLLLIFLFAESLSHIRFVLFQVVVITLLIGTTTLIAYNSYKNFNLEYTYLWRLDTYNKQMLKAIEEDRLASNSQDSVRVSCIWNFEPGINYYRVSRDYNWLIPANREGLKKEGDYYICSIQDTSQITCDSLIVLKKYDDVQTILLKRYKSK